MTKLEVKQNEIAVFRVQDHLDMVILKDRVNEEGEQLFKVGTYNRESDGYGLLDYNLSFDNAVKVFNKRIYTNLRLKFLGVQTINRKSSFPIEWEEMISKQYMKETLQHILGLFDEDMLDYEDLEEKIDELS